MKFVDVYENDYGKIIILPTDATLRIFQTENPSTGYRWQVEDISRSCFQIVSSEFLANNQLIGAAGIEVFYFTPVRPGRCTIYLKLWRSWEGDKSIVRRFRIGVSVIPTS